MSPLASQDIQNDVIYRVDCRDILQNVRMIIMAKIPEDYITKESRPVSIAM